MANSGQWATIFACFSINFLLLGTARLAPLYYVEFTYRFNASREQASLPFILVYTMRHGFGPISGYFATRFGLQEVTMVGCLLSVVGIGICFFAEHIVTVTVFWGLIFGLGFGFGGIFLASIINEHIPRKHQSKAQGIALTGSSVGTIILPYLVECSIEKYGVSGSFLVLSAILFHAVPAAMLLKSKNSKPNGKLTTENELVDVFVENQKSDSDANLVGENVQVFGDKHAPETNADMAFPNTCEKHIRLEENFVYIGVHQCAKKINCHDAGNKNCHDAANSRLHNKRRSITHQKNDDMDNGETMTGILQATGAIESLDHLNKKNCDVDDSETMEGILQVTSDIESLDHLNKKNSDVDDGETMEGMADCETMTDGTIELPNCLLKPKKSNTPSKATKNSIAMRSFRVFLNKSFIALALSQSVFVFTITTLWTIMIDLLIDQDVDKPIAINMFSVSILVDIIGRLCLSYMLDKRWITFTNFGVFMYISMGTSFVATTLPFGQIFLVFALLMTAFFSGGIVTYLPCAVEEFIENDQKTMAMASRMIFFFPLSFATSPLIGYFREVRGSYHGLIYVLAATSYLCALLVFAVPRLQTNRKTDNNRAFSQNKNT